ncbi:MAG: histidine kinase [Crocinitomicaceae bacterium]|nr:histidine kinase [Crocinitomicaceae bacterium]
MERKTILYWVAQVIGWSAYYVFSILLLLATKQYIVTLNLVLWVSASILCSIILSHGMRWLILKMDLLSKKLAVLLTYSILFSLAAGFGLEAFQYVLDTRMKLDFVLNNQVDPFDWAIYMLATTRSMILFALWAGFYYVFIIIEKSRKQELLNLQWQASKNEIELKNLRAQLNPHFLFNSLNSIRALVALNPEQAKSAITQLSGLLRNSINLGKLKLISLKDELELVEHYLKLEQIRFEERLRVTVKTSDVVKNCQIPPLMIQTLVENAIKHGISKSISGGDIDITADMTGNKLQITIDNTGNLGSIGDEENGVGITNTKKRLAILFGDRADFSLKQVGDKVRANIQIQYT